MKNVEKELELIKFYTAHFDGEQLDKLIISVIQNAYFSGIIESKYGK